MRIDKSVSPSVSQLFAHFEVIAKRFWDRAISATQTAGGRTETSIHESNVKSSFAWPKLTGKKTGKALTMTATGDAVSGGACASARVAGTSKIAQQLHV